MHFLIAQQPFLLHESKDHGFALREGADCYIYRQFHSSLYPTFYTAGFELYDVYAVFKKHLIFHFSGVVCGRAFRLESSEILARAAQDERGVACSD